MNNSYKQFWAHEITIFPSEYKFSNKYLFIVQCIMYILYTHLYIYIYIYVVIEAKSFESQIGLSIAQYQKLWLFI